MDVMLAAGPRRRSMILATPQTHRLTLGRIDLPEHDVPIDIGHIIFHVSRVAIIHAARIVIEKMPYLGFRAPIIAAAAQ